MGKSLPIVGELLRDELGLPSVLVIVVLKFARHVTLLGDADGGKGRGKVVYSRDTWVQDEGGYGPTRLGVYNEIYCYYPANEELRCVRDLGNGRKRVTSFREYSGIFRRFCVDEVVKTGVWQFPRNWVRRETVYRGYHHDDPKLYAFCEKNGIVLDMRKWYGDGAEAYRVELCRELMRI
jgi:hypothetical protein